MSTRALSSEPGQPQRGYNIGDELIVPAVSSAWFCLGVHDAHQERA